LTYNEIFINSEYAVPIQAAMKVSSAKPFVVMDLGANVGYFAFRVFDPIIQRHLDDIPPDITMGQGKSRNSWKTGGKRVLDVPAGRGVDVAFVDVNTLMKDKGRDRSVEVRHRRR
jgi:hypothetical protein